MARISWPIHMLSPTQRFTFRLVLYVVGFLLFKWLILDSRPETPPGEIAHPAILERITLNVPLASTSLDPQKYPFLQTRINRDETPSLFDQDIRDGRADFWARFQRPFATSRDTFHLDEQVVRSSIEELLGFNGWAAAACSSLTRPFGLQKAHDDYRDLTRPGSLYYFALVVHGADHFLIDQLAVIVQLSRKLGPQSIFVSLLDYASTDSTPFLCDMAEAVLTLLGIAFRIRQVAPMTADPTASYYPLEEAYTRNLALEPLLELWTRRNVRFTRVIWLKGFTCPNDILETIRISFANQAALVCSMDWKEHNGFFIYNDRWRTRDMDGNLFRGSKSTSPIDEAPPRDAIGSARYALHLPFQVFCCESGTHIVDPNKSYYHGLTYKSYVDNVFNITASADGKAPRWSEGPCMDSAQLHFCRDMWMLAFRDGVLQESRRLANEHRLGNAVSVHPFMEALIDAAKNSLTVLSPEKQDAIKIANSGDYIADETMIEVEWSSPKANKAPLVRVDEGPHDDAVGNLFKAPPVFEENAPEGDVVAGVEAAAAAEVAELEQAGGAGAAPAAPAVAKGAAAPGAEAAAEAAADNRRPMALVNDLDDANVAEAKADAQADAKAAAEADAQVAAAAAGEAGEAPAKAPEKRARKNHVLEKRAARSLPNHYFPYAIAKILVNPRCVTTYAGVSHTQLALDLFGSGDDKEPTALEGGKYILDEWRTPPESFVCQEMRTTGGRVAAKQQRRAGFQQARLLLNGWRPM